MKKSITNFTEFRQIIIRTSKKYEVYWTRYGFYYRTKKCDFFYSCRAVIDRVRVFDFLRKNCVKHYELEAFV